MLSVGIVLSFLMGVTLGLLGGGGSILTVPILVYALGVPPKPAIATSLLVVGVTGAVSASLHARRRNVRWRVGLLFGLVAMIGSFLGGHLARFFSGATLLFLFTAVMMVTGLAMLRDRREEAPSGGSDAPTLKIAAVGLCVGSVTGLVGAGGGFVIVPALTLWGGLPMHTAVGTSLLIIAMNSFSGFAGYVSHVEVNLRLAAAVAAASVAGAVVGARAASHVSPASLRRAFAWLVLCMAVFMLYEQARP